MQLRAALSFKGRFSRRQFWLYWLGSIVALGLAMMLIGVLEPLGQTATFIGLPVVITLIALACWVSLATQVKRWHDQDRSGWMILVTFIPFVGFLISIVCLGFLRGSAGENRFGRPGETAAPAATSPFVAPPPATGEAPPRLVETPPPAPAAKTAPRRGLRWVIVLAVLLFILIPAGGLLLFLIPPAKMAVGRSWLKASLTGNATECQALGWRYRKGDGVAQDYARAAQWFGRAADKGLPQAQYDLAVMEFYGLGIPSSEEQAKSHLEAAVRQDYVPAMTLLGLLRDQLYQDDEEARVLWMRAAEAGDPWAASLLGSRYLRHRGEGENNENLIRALYWLESAHRDGVDTVGGLLQHVWATVPEADVGAVTREVFSRMQAGNPDPLPPPAAVAEAKPTENASPTETTPKMEENGEEGGSPLANEVLAKVRSLPDYVAVSTLYAEKSQEDSTWPASDEGQAVGRYLQAMRSDAQSAVVRDKEGGGKILAYNVGGHEVTDADVRCDDLSSDENYRAEVVEAVARNIVGAPRPMVVNEFLKKSGKGGGN